jgi:CBS domain-containing protein
MKKRNLFTVRDVMTPDPLTCSPGDHLGTAAWRMWQGDCGILPVVYDGSVVGVITDRDIAMTLGLRGRRPEDIRVGEVMQAPDAVVTCGPDDSASEALVLMRECQIRRLPVIENGVLTGIVSLNDFALAAGAGANGTGRPTLRDVAQTLREVCGHRTHSRAA